MDNISYILKLFFKNITRKVVIYLTKTFLPPSLHLVLLDYFDKSVRFCTKAMDGTWSFNISKEDVRSN